MPARSPRSRIGVLAHVAGGGVASVGVAGVPGVGQARRTLRAALPCGAGAAQSLRRRRSWPTLRQSSTVPPTMVNHQRLAGVLVDFARNLVGDYEIDAMLDTLCREVSAILQVRGAGVMITDEQGDLRFVAASDERVRAIEDLQIELGEGPCLHAYVTGEPVVEDDLEAGSEFPAFAPRALQAGLRGVYSFPMRLHAGDQHLGALNLYTASPGAFDEEDWTTGQILADVATSYILNARAFERSTRLTGQLQHALETRVIIEQAKGKVSEQLRVGVGDAFEQLRQYARRNRRKLHDVADEVVHGQLRLGDS